MNKWQKGQGTSETVFLTTIMFIKLYNSIIFNTKQGADVLKTERQHVKNIHDNMKNFVVTA